MVVAVLEQRDGELAPSALDAAECARRRSIKMVQRRKQPRKPSDSNE